MVSFAKGVAGGVPVSVVRNPGYVFEDERDVFVGREGMGREGGMGGREERVQSAIPIARREREYRDYPRPEIGSSYPREPRPEIATSYPRESIHTRELGSYSREIPTYHRELGSYPREFQSSSHYSRSSVFEEDSEKSDSYMDRLSHRMASYSIHPEKDRISRLVMEESSSHSFPDHVLLSNARSRVTPREIPVSRSYMSARSMIVPPNSHVEKERDGPRSLSNADSAVSVTGIPIEKKYSWNPLLYGSLDFGIWGEEEDGIPRFSVGKSL